MVWFIEFGDRHAWKGENIEVEHFARFRNLGGKWHAALMNLDLTTLNLIEFQTGVFHDYI